MKPRLAFLLIILKCSVLLAQPVDLSTRRQYSLTILRSFRNKLNSLESSPSRDSLVNKVNKIVNIVKTTPDTLGLELINAYFNTIFDNVDSQAIARDSIIYYFNRDLGMKINLITKNTDFPLESSSSLFQSYKVKVAILINGIPQKSGNYTLYWTFFRGGDPGQIIKKNQYAGNSNKFEIPLAVSVILPGYITFWLQDAVSLKIYKALPSFIVMDNTQTQIELNFIPI
jgi:hypothetical protein